MANDDYDKLMDHNYDGIEEYDNPLPGWWRWLFILSIAFSVLYFMYYHMGVGPTVQDKYQAQVTAFYEKQLAVLGVSEPTDEAIIRLSNDEAMMDAVSRMFQGNCGQCHRADGGGNIGPNLTDDSWKNVETPEDIFGVIKNGVPGTAMTAWDYRFRDAQIILLAAYVTSLRGSDPPNAKGPEGRPIPPWPEAPESGDDVASDGESEAGATGSTS